MTTLSDLIPDVDVMLALDASELAPHLLTVAKSQMQNSMFHPSNVTVRSNK